MTDRRDIPLFYKRPSVERPVASRIAPSRLVYFCFMLVVIGLGGWLYLFQASVVAGYAHEIRELEWRKERIHREIVALHAELAELGSLQRIRERSMQAGFSLPEASDKERHLYLEYEIPVRPEPLDAAPSEALERPGADSGNGQGLLQRLFKQVEDWLTSPIERRDSR